MPQRPAFAPVRFCALSLSAYHLAITCGGASSAVQPVTHFTSTIYVAPSTSDFAVMARRNLGAVKQADATTRERGGSTQQVHVHAGSNYT
jgi:hypothetical protein